MPTERGAGGEGKGGGASSCGPLPPERPGRREDVTGSLFPDTTMGNETHLNDNRSARWSQFGAVTRERRLHLSQWVYSWVEKKEDLMVETIYAKQGDDRHLIVSLAFSPVGQSEECYFLRGFYYELIQEFSRVDVLRRDKTRQVAAPESRKTTNSRIMSKSCELKISEFFSL